MKAIRTMAPKDIDEYIAASPSEVQLILKKIRMTISAAAPGAQEVISYRMPAFRLHGIVVYFAAFKAHIGLYPPVSGDASLEKALSPYAGPMRLSTKSGPPVIPKSGPPAVDGRSFLISSRTPWMAVGARG
jgi:hypothetical protein